MRRWFRLTMITIVMLLVSGNPAAAAASNPESSGTALSAQVHVWVESLSKQEGFQSWKQAKTTITPIGPGQHGWLVTLRDQKAKPVGYLIVHANENGGFTLGEYGSGSHPAFDPNTLYQSMVQQGLIESFEDAIKRPLKLERLYVHPLLAVWKWSAPDGQTYYLDAWTAEALPINDKDWQAAVDKFGKQPLHSGIGLSVTTITAKRMNPIFDAYERMPWLTKKPLDSSRLSVMNKLLDHNKRIRYTAELYDQNVLFVWPAIGYHQWNDNQLYIAFDQYGSRYVPMRDLTGKGLFFDE